MVFRRIVTGFLALLFVSVSLAAFVVFALTNTFFRQSFYTEDLKQPAYEFLVSSTVLSIKEQGGLINEYFTESDLRREVRLVFPEDLFVKMLEQFISEMDVLQEDPNMPVPLRLGTFRESLLTLAHNLSFKIFESLPECAAGEIPEEEESGLPSCVPAEVEYNAVSGPLTQQFEKSIYAAIPQQVEFNPNDIVGAAEVNISSAVLALDTLNTTFYVSLLLLVALMALIIYRPFTAIVMIEGVVFTVSGVLGFIMSMVVRAGPSMSNFFEINGQFGYLAEPVGTFLSNALELFGLEIQKASLLFIALGAALLLVRYYLVKRK